MIVRKTPASTGTARISSTATSAHAIQATMEKIVRMTSMSALWSLVNMGEPAKTTSTHSSAIVPKASLDPLVQRKLMSA